MSKKQLKLIGFNCCLLLFLGLALFKAPTAGAQAQCTGGTSKCTEESCCCPTDCVKKGYKTNVWQCGFMLGMKNYCCKDIGGPLFSPHYHRVYKIPCNEITVAETDLFKKGVTANDLNNLNPLRFLNSSKTGVFFQGSDFVLAGFINELISYLFPIAGLILFVMISWGGFEMLTGAASKKSLDAGKQRVTAAIIGFLLLFSSYWLIQIIEAITGATILGGS